MSFFKEIHLHIREWRNITSATFTHTLHKKKQWFVLKLFWKLGLFLNVQKKVKDAGQLVQSLQQICTMKKKRYKLKEASRQNKKCKCGPGWYSSWHKPVIKAHFGDNWEIYLCLIRWNGKWRSLTKEEGQARWLTPLIPATWEAEIGRIEVWGQPGKKLRSSATGIHLSFQLYKKNSHQDCCPGCPEQKTWDPIWKRTKAKRAGGVAQVVGDLPSKHQALSLNPSNAKKLNN
jgi:hypothetical protein